MPNAMAAMERGDIDCYLRTVGEYQGLGRRKETQGIIIGTIDLSTGGDGWAADQSIKSVCDLKGKTIAVEPNLPARLMMQMALKKECNLSIKDTNLSDLAAADAIGAFADTNLAAVGTYEPVLSQVVAAHQDRGAHIVASSKDYDDLILDIIMAHTGELKAHPDKYVKFLRAIYRAIDYFNANQEKAIPIIAAQFSITPEDFKATLPNFRYTPFDEALRHDRHGRQGRPRLRGLPRGDGPEPRVRLVRREARCRRTTSTARSSTRSRRTGSEARGRRRRRGDDGSRRASQDDDAATGGGRRGRRAVAAGRECRVAAGGWRELFAFRGKPSANLELWVGIGAFVFVLAVWALVTELALVKPQFLPSPWAVVAAWFGLFQTAGYAGDIGISVARVWVAFLASAVIAIPLGMLMSSYRGVGAFSEPLIDFIRYLPVPALVPLTLIWLGIGEELEDRAAVDRHLLPAGAARRRRCAARAEGVHRDRPDARRRTTAR